MQTTLVKFPWRNVTRLVKFYQFVVTRLMKFVLVKCELLSEMYFTKRATTHDLLSDIHFTKPVTTHDLLSEIHFTKRVMTILLKLPKPITPLVKFWPFH